MGRGRLGEIMEEELGVGIMESGGAAELPETAQLEMVSEEEDDFEFAFSIDSDPGSLPDTTADEIFYNGKILPVYPVFNRDLVGGTGNPKEEDDLAEGVARLMMEYEKRDMRSGSHESSSSSEAKDLERLSRSAPSNFVPPSPDRWRKSGSTGSSASSSVSRKWKLRDLVVGRSRSDGKERFVFSGRGGSGGGQPAAAGGYRRSFLPYRQELLGGIFGNAKHHPF
ncbi:uncharacterized protein LOC110037916 [Phalaenopsis equestris]|uniref:uncharacterized protein LOC110037916 n=1 Tax=Phalaenopsis equestris TaxID=78828 RepID=UPI0009E4D554|nr:uncharacterized protein LOC110037916 [Phalaenopsis equestris]